MVPYWFQKTHGRGLLFDLADPHLPAQFTTLLTTLLIMGGLALEASPRLLLICSFVEYLSNLGTFEAKEREEEAIPDVLPWLV